MKQEQVTIQVKYEGYIRREWAQVKQSQALESWKIPDDIDYDSIHGLSKEAREKLSKVRPLFLRSSIKDFWSFTCRYICAFYYTKSDETE